MTGDDIHGYRKKFELSRTAFALLLGYVGNDRNNDTRVRRLEAEEEPSLLLCRFLWLVDRWRDEHGALPAWPEELKIEGEEQPWM
jgi:hypothetical protein